MLSIIIFSCFYKRAFINGLVFKKEEMKAVPNENKQIFKEISFTSYSIFKKVDPENNADHVSLELRKTKSIV